MVFSVLYSILIFKILTRININGIAKHDRQKADDVGPTSLTLTSKGLMPRHAAPKIRVIAIKNIDGFSKNIFKFQ